MFRKNVLEHSFVFFFLESSMHTTSWLTWWVRVSRLLLGSPLAADGQLSSSEKKLRTEDSFPGTFCLFGWTGRTGSFGIIRSHALSATSSSHFNMFWVYGALKSHGGDSPKKEKKNNSPLFYLPSLDFFSFFFPFLFWQMLLLRACLIATVLAVSIYPIAR